MTFKNPILPGFYPEPSVCRVKDDYYLVTATFGYFPGVPIFHSKDLVNWRQIGNVLDRPSQLPLDGAEISRGIFASTLRYYDGVFYLTSTNVSHGGNFLVTATDPAGPWSEPFYIHGAAGINPSLFFDTDGRCYYHGTCERQGGGKFFGDNEIYLQELDLGLMKLTGQRFVIWHGALKDSVWAESPHIYKKGEYYYLLISEGGSGHEHAVTVARSKTLTGYYTGHKSNPILTHRHLGKNYPIVNVGHGDLVDTPGGQAEWWMVVLASRPYGGRYRNLGRETFLVPVIWEDDWPVVNCGIGLVREEERFPKLAASAGKEKSLAEGDCGFYDFRKMAYSAGGLPMNMMFLRNPVPGDYMLKNDGPGAGLHLRLNKNTIAELSTVSYCCVRQQHKSFEARTRLFFTPVANENVGLVLFQSHKFHYQFVRTCGWLRVLKCENGRPTILAETSFPDDLPDVHLKIIAQEQDLSFFFSPDGQNFSPVHENADARILSTDVAGGFVGTTIGMYASSNGEEAGEKFAVFTDFAYRGY